VRVTTRSSATNAGLKTKRSKKQKEVKNKKKNMKNYKTIIAAVALGIACSAVTSKATLAAISPGQTIYIGAGGPPTPFPVQTPIVDTVGGTLVATSTSPYDWAAQNGPDDTGILTTYVYNDPTDTKGYTFLYQDQVTGGDVNAITVNGFTKPVVGVATGSGSSADVGQVVYGSFGQITFQWDQDAVAGPGTFLDVVVASSSFNYGSSVAGISDSTFGNTPDLAPVPEPSTVVAGILMLLPFGIGAVRSLRKERA
jgi:hypothetical protein